MKKFSREERRLIAGMSFLMGARMLGVSLLIPVMSIIATEMKGSTLALAGVAVGIFGISQTVMQVPMGWLSDRWGRKRATMLGLGIYLLGTVLCGFSVNVEQLIAGRIIAGAGAFQGVAMAWLTDGIDEGRRNEALSFVGMSIGAAVILGFTFSPVIAGYAGTMWLFHVCAAFTLVAIILACLFLEEGSAPASGKAAHAPAAAEVGLARIMSDRDLALLNAMGLTGNLVMSAVFFALPLMLKPAIPVSGMWKIFVPMAVAGTACMYYFGKKADVIGTGKVVAAACVFEGAGLALPLLSHDTTVLVASFMLFYAGHCVLSPVLPAAVSHYPSARQKGTVMGIFNSGQFIGSGLGGMLAGAMMKYDPAWLFAALLAFLACAGMAMAWFTDFRRRPPMP